MAKKKPRNVYNVDEIRLEIDYDKLADAIVKANERQSQKYSMSREWMKFVIYPVFWGVAFIAGILSVICLVYGGNTLSTALSTANGINWSQLATGFTVCCVALFLVAVCLFAVFTAKEIDKETDRQYVASMFSNIVALVALIVSFVALFGG